MLLYTLGFTQKSAEEFFTMITENQVQTVLDIRLNNQSQLAGFTKGRDLAYFLKQICHCDYAHNQLFAPTKEILTDYKHKDISWNDYEVLYRNLMINRNVVSVFRSNYMKNKNNVCLLCSEPEPEQCHRRLLAEMLKENINGINIEHL